MNITEQQDLIKKNLYENNYNSYIYAQVTAHGVRLKDSKLSR